MADSLTWARTVPAQFRPAILNTRHTDWLWPLSYTPRYLTAWFGVPPRKIEGNAPEFEFWYRFTGYYWQPCMPSDDGAQSFTHPYPIPKRGEWWRGKPDYYARTDEGGIYVRNGYRWDNVDGYYEYPSFTVKVF